MSEQGGKQASALQPPTTTDPKAWITYWKAQGQPWRTEPEIGAERQKYLTERRSIKPDIEQGIYPFKDIEPKLTRADVEWLLATHENGRGPVDWHDESKWVRVGLDLRGADLCEVDLTNLPLTRMIGGIFGRELPAATKEQCDMAAVHMKRARLVGTHLEGARLRFAHLENAHLRFTHLD